METGPSMKRLRAVEKWLSIRQPPVTHEGEEELDCGGVDFSLVVEADVVELLPGVLSGIGEGLDSAEVIGIAGWFFDQQFAVIVG
jgi:hypothetical protein